MVIFNLHFGHENLYSKKVTYIFKGYSKLFSIIITFIDPQSIASVFCRSISSTKEINWCFNLLLHKYNQFIEHSYPTDAEQPES